MRKRLVRALMAYVILIGIACFLLSGKVLASVLIIFGALIAKTLIAMKAGWQPPNEAADDFPADFPK